MRLPCLCINTLIPLILDLSNFFWYILERRLFIMNDIEIKNDHVKFKYRVNGILIRDNKILALKMKNNISYCLPGGHVELAEDSKSAMFREMLEETQTEMYIDNDFAIIESFYLDNNNLQTHEISFYYTLLAKNYDKIPFENYSLTELDNGKQKTHNFEWLDISKLHEIDFRPAFIKEKLISGKYDFEHFIVKE